MPNYCWNRLTIFGPAADVKRFVESARGEGPVYDQAFEEAERKAKRDGVAYNPDDVKPSVSDLQFHAIAPLPGYTRGMDYSNKGYDLEANTWGVKWGAWDVRRVYDGGDLARYEFTTAWGVACELFKAASAKFPTLIFALSFYEEFPTLGRFTWNGGVEMRDAYIEGGFPEEKDDDEVDSDEWRERVYKPWHRQFYDVHDEWVAKLRAKVTP